MNQYDKNVSKTESKSDRVNVSSINETTKNKAKAKRKLTQNLWYKFNI